ncbi:hypothetical protein RPE78_02880 [Thioclava litoralis]|uniref:Lipoprotein n=1 Tax=Thioclava litoralis TaxID=3076557 RepID=A0ABZ1DZM2_9RHOB|nr:hypothetical protein RPE78_02880 [Thioclava sp. FTW29]
MKHFTTALALGLTVLAAGCSTVELPPEGTPYFEMSVAGDNLYPLQRTAYYENGSVVYSEAKHSYNNNRGALRSHQEPGLYARMMQAWKHPTQADRANAPAQMSPEELMSCSHCPIYSFTWFDGQTSRGVPAYAFTPALTRSVVE